MKNILNTWSLSLKTYLIRNYASFPQPHFEDFPKYDPKHKYFKLNWMQHIALKISNCKIATIDIETFIGKDKQQVPYNVCIYFGDKDKYKSFYLKDFNCNQLEYWNFIYEYLFKHARGYRIYAHNQGGFDSQFLINGFQLCKYSNSNIRFIRGNSTKISITIEIPGKGKGLNKISFYDSYKLLPHSLKKLGESFGLEVSKGEFPHKFSSLENLDYLGKWPSCDNYHKPPKEINKNLFDFRSESIHYIKIDCKLLHEILKTFMDRMIDNHHLNPLKSQTLPSLCFKQFRGKFLRMNVDRIRINLGNEINNFLRDGYYGGHVDVYKPLLDKCYAYDINSQFPYAMRNFPMPIGSPTKVYKEYIDFFGFGEYNIDCPESIKIPVLPYKTKDKKDNYYGRTIFPTGKWSGIYFSEEIKHARKLGYTCTFVRGYGFNKNYDLFKEYVDYFFDLKSTATNPIDRAIAKFMLNSLYGRQAMLNYDSINQYTNSDDVYNYYKNKNVIQFEEDANDFGFIQLIVEDKKIKADNISVAIAAAITSYSRITIDGYKRFPNNTLAYSDTDSVYLSNPIDDKFLGKDLGLMKSENGERGYLLNCIFLAPKIYGYDKDGKIVITCKGIEKGLVSYNDLLTLYSGKIVTYTFDRLFKNNLGIVSKKQPYIQGDEEFVKRVKVFDRLGKWIDTKPRFIIKPTIDLFIRKKWFSTYKINKNIYPIESNKIMKFNDLIETGIQEDKKWNIMVLNQSIYNVNLAHAINFEQPQYISWCILVVDMNKMYYTNYRVLIYDYEDLVMSYNDSYIDKEKYEIEGQRTISFIYIHVDKSNILDKSNICTNIDKIIKLKLKENDINYKNNSKALIRYNEDKNNSKTLIRYNEDKNNSKALVRYNDDKNNIKVLVRYNEDRNNYDSNNNNSNNYYENNYKKSDRITIIFTITVTILYIVAFQVSFFMQFLDEENEGKVNISLKELKNEIEIIYNSIPDKKDGINIIQTKDELIEDYIYKYEKGTLMEINTLNEQDENNIINLEVDEINEELLENNMLEKNNKNNSLNIVEDKINEENNELEGIAQMEKWEHNKIYPEKIGLALMEEWNDNNELNPISIEDRCTENFKIDTTESINQLNYIIDHNIALNKVQADDEDPIQSQNINNEQNPIQVVEPSETGLTFKPIKLTHRYENIYEEKEGE